MHDKKRYSEKKNRSEAFLIHRYNFSYLKILWNILKPNKGIYTGLGTPNQCKNQFLYLWRKLIGKWDWWDYTIVSKWIIKSKCNIIDTGPVHWEV